MEPDKTPEFEKWIVSSTPTWKWEWPHQELIYRHLRRVTSGEVKRLMIFMPPRHSKSETVTVRYTAWRMIREPAMNVILGSYNQRLANRFSRKIRRLAGAGTDLSKDRKAVDEWETAAGGTLCAVGVGSGVTGYGASLIVIDDPVKSRAEAESRAYRESTWDWFNDDIYTRLEPGAAMVLIQTRWHEDDLAGRLLREMEDGGERWEVLSLPAIAEDNDPLGRSVGEALCPDRYDIGELLRIRKKLGEYTFTSLYQQRPVPREGGLFKRKWFSRIVDHPPEGLRWFRGYDLAASTRTSADFTASFRCAIDEESGDLYIADGFRGRIEGPEQQRYIIGRMEAEENTVHGIEAALHGRIFVQELRRQVSLAGVPLRAVEPDGDKFTRALAWANRAAEGKVVLVRGPWIADFIEEATRFPDGRHDDQVDAVSLAVKLMSEKGYSAMGF